MPQQILILTFQITRPKKKKALPSPATLGSSSKPRRKRQTDLADHQSQREESTFTQPPGLIKGESGYSMGLFCQYAREYRAHLNCTVENSTSNDSEVKSTDAAIFSGSPKTRMLRPSCYTYMSVYLCVWPFNSASPDEQISARRSPMPMDSGIQSSNRAAKSRARPDLDRFALWSEISRQIVHVLVMTSCL